jgi:nucleoside diphosphate-linked moiety X motif protein 19
MLKRSSKSKFMPNAYVFPGGVTSGADFASGWKDHFLHHGYNDDDLEELVLKDVDRPMLMKAEVDESISRDIAVRWDEFL